MDNGTWEAECYEYDCLEDKAKKLDCLPIRVYTDNKSKTYVPAPDDGAKLENAWNSTGILPE
jgi:hypothetical protein